MRTQRKERAEEGGGRWRPKEPWGSGRPRVGEAWRLGWRDPEEQQAV